MNEIVFEAKSIGSMYGYEVLYYKYLICISENIILFHPNRSEFPLCVEQNVKEWKTVWNLNELLVFILS